MNVANILSTLAVMGLKTLRENIVLARVVNRQYEQAIVSAQKGSTINVVVPTAVGVADVTAAATPPSTTSITPTVVPITLTKHQEAAFYLTDFDLMRVQDGIIPMQAEEAVKALANAIDAFLWTKANFYGFTGTPGTTPLATDLTAFLAARKIANNNLMPMDNRFVIYNADVEANALALRAFQDASFGGGNSLQTGQIGYKLGANWMLSQNVPTRALAAAGTILLDDTVARPVGTKTLHMDGITTLPVAGEIFTIAGDTQTYAVQSTSVLSTNDADITFEPGLKVAIPAADGNEVVTFKAAHAKNILLHRDAIGFAMAPLLDSAIVPNLVAMQAIVDEASGLSLRVEVTREHKRWRWSYDAMWGAALIRPELGVIMAG